MRLPIKHRVVLIVCIIALIAIILPFLVQREAIVPTQPLLSTHIPPQPEIPKVPLDLPLAPENLSSSKSK